MIPIPAPVEVLEDERALLEALHDELERDRAELSLADAPPIYHLRYRLLSVRAVEVHAAAGSLVRVSDRPSNVLGVELRVGTPEWDNTGFGGWEDGFQIASLPRDLTPWVLREGAWRATDAAYKQAVEQHARKSAQVTPPADYPGDYTLTGPVSFDDGVGGRSDVAALSELAKALTAPLAGSPILAGEAWIGDEQGAAWTLDSEGSATRLPVRETSLRVVAQLRAPDGALLTDQRLWTARSAADLPPRDVMLAEVQAMRDGLVALAAAPPLDEEYVGPVLFEGAAAADLFRYLLTDQIEGTPAEIPFDSFFGDLGMSKDSVRVGRRVLPLGWSAVDDPTRAPDGVGGYLHDWEGQPAVPVEVVRDGIARDLLMSRVPRTGIPGSNGHARGYLGLRAEGRVSQLEITAPRRMSTVKLRKEALSVARAYGRDWVIVVRRLQEPSVLGLSSDPAMEGGAALPPPVGLVRLYADGREEPLRGASFASVERWLLRDLLAAGPQRAADYLAPIFGDDWDWLGPVEGLPTAISAPDVLIGEAELVPSPGDPRETPVLPFPPGP